MNVLTYGTFDALHYGHVILLNRLKSLGDKLYVGVSTDAFNLQKGKVAFMSYEDRVTLLQSLRAVDVVFPENDWEQKVADIKKYNIGLFAIGDDWAGHFDYLSKYCKVVYMPRTANISSTEIRRIIMQKKD
ncbi:adenylyltransferase/cytidyltransferase family protein [Sutterella faecalis]|uniref:Adenylyltransferase/cytidyltransferase family protein n=2 Tax=Sutterella TaxID=40544 RepID=A0AAI9SDJ6_9BURK|nr:MULTISPECIES: adenylyltransferase/cytidyltransferase family protein [Sutterella]KAB7651490.1 adenylyltransferase/cytidyltransferase family protein [Sutterella seckii]QDA55179.1 adenylyltransferase/cytidyltransferase family protein [Sutterella faecalis]